MRKTKAEIEDLKTGWLRDACWDLEETEDFQDHREELLAFRLAQEARWEEEAVARKAADQQRIHTRAVALGVPGAVPLVRYIESLESRLAARIEVLEDKIEKASHYIDWSKKNWHE